VLALLFWVLPMEIIFKSCIEVESTATTLSYEAAKHRFWDDYDRRNPVTMQRAIEEWVSTDPNKLYSFAPITNQAAHRPTHERPNAGSQTNRSGHALDQR
jgi:hypothetical protein